MEIGAGLEVGWSVIRSLSLKWNQLLFICCPFLARVASQVWAPRNVPVGSRNCGCQVFLWCSFVYLQRVYKALCLWTLRESKSRKQLLSLTTRTVFSACTLTQKPPLRFLSGSDTALSAAPFSCLYCSLMLCVASSHKHTHTYPEQRSIKIPRQVHIFTLS